MPIIGLNESLVNINIKVKFNVDSVNPLDQTNKKWFINLTGRDIPPMVSDLFQMDSKFSLPDLLSDSHNKAQ